MEVLTDKVLEEIEKLKTEPITDAELNKIKEAERTNAEDGFKYNGYWASKLRTAYQYKFDLGNILDYETEIDNLSASDFKKAANQYFKEDYAVFILMPEERSN